VNVVIALAILGVLVSLNIAIPDGMSYSRGYLPNLFLVNVILVLFNLIPAFPMDGGRVLRSLLSMKIGFLRATELAARIGQAISVAFFVFGLFAGHVIMVLIAVFVFLAGGAEARAARFAPPGAGGWGGGRPDPDDADSGLPDHPEREQWGG
jgi:stage IV sporulation protein FB